MSSVYIEFKPKRDEFVAMQGGREIARGDTQAEAINGARDNRKGPDDPMLAERQRLRHGKPAPDKWRRVY